MLETIRAACPQARFYQASSSRCSARRGADAERDHAVPSALALCRGQAVRPLDDVNYRESYGLHALSGILFNHESPLRGVEFVTRKITRAARIRLGLQEKLRLGNLDAKRDWGHARDYVKAMWLMLQQDEAGRLRRRHRARHSVREFCALAFAHAGLEDG